mmetsp:Transcript_3331/g.2883  ORF Transcript_3331/g.2883 Transcript_3331/m.2883 type:complete len:135 (+) Transcript_3331:725-1129(+)
MPKIDEDVNQKDVEGLVNPFSKNEIEDEISDQVLGSSEKISQFKQRKNSEIFLHISKDVSERLGDNSTLSTDTSFSKQSKLIDFSQNFNIKYTDWQVAQMHFKVQITDTRLNSGGLFGYGAYTSYTIQSSINES